MPTQKKNQQAKCYIAPAVRSPGSTPAGGRCDHGEGVEKSESRDAGLSMPREELKRLFRESWKDDEQAYRYLGR